MSPSKSKKRNIKNVGPLRLAILAGLGYIAVLNIEPYSLTVAPIVSSPDAAVVGMFYRIPILGPRIQDLGWLLGLGAGVLPWALVQTFQTLPSVLEADRKNLKSAIDGIVRNAQSLNVPPDSDPRLSALVAQYNNLPARTLARFYTLRLVAYLVDTAVVLWHYPPFKDGWEFLSYGVYPLPGDFAWGNILTSVAILFVFQWLVEMFLWLGNVKRYLVIQEVTAA